MFKKFSFFLVLITLMPIICFGKPYMVTDDLIQELINNKKAVQILPNAENYFELAMTYAYTGLIEEGLKALKQVQKYDDKYADIVISKYTAKIKNNPNNWKNYFKLAFGYYFSHKKQKAIMELQQVLKINPKNIWAMGYIALLKGELLLNDIQKLKQENIPSKEIMQQKEKDFQYIFTLCNKALDIEPNAGAIHFLKAQTFYIKGDYFGFMSEALTAFKFQAKLKKYLKEKGV